MTKVKVFSCATPDQLTDAINDFIKDKTVLDVKFDNFWAPTQMCGPSITAIDIYARALIIYREVDS